MAAPIDGALYRMKSYATLLTDSVNREQNAIGLDIMSLVAWVEHARPLLGAVSPAPPDPRPVPPPPVEPADAPLDAPDEPVTPPPADAPAEDQPTA